MWQFYCLDGLFAFVSKHSCRVHLLFCSVPLFHQVISSDVGIQWSCLYPHCGDRPAPSHNGLFLFPAIRQTYLRLITLKHDFSSARALISYRLKHCVLYTQHSVYKENSSSHGHLVGFLRIHRSWGGGRGGCLKTNQKTADRKQISLM